MKNVKKAEKSPWMVKKSKPGSKKKSKADFCDDKKKSLAKVHGTINLMKRRTKLKRVPAE